MLQKKNTSHESGPLDTVAVDAFPCVFTLKMHRDATFAAICGIRTHWHHLAAAWRTTFAAICNIRAHRHFLATAWRTTFVANGNVRVHWHRLATAWNSTFAVICGIRMHRHRLATACKATVAAICNIRALWHCLATAWTATFAAICNICAHRHGLATARRATFTAICIASRRRGNQLLLLSALATLPPRGNRFLRELLLKGNNLKWGSDVRAKNLVFYESVFL
jgi:hypothetical protein